MSVPYETCGTHEAFESPDACLQRLLARTLNSFELPDETLSRLDTALAYDSCLHSAAHHSDGRRRETYRHVWLVADGSAVTLWELTHNTGPDGQLHHEVYTDQEELRIATARLPLPSAEPEALEGAPPLVVDDRPAQPLPGREYEWGDSPDHARRVLRRAENADRPGEEVAVLLAGAFAHQITQAFGRLDPLRGRRPGFSLYEHAFLLADGREVSLWEVEHTATPDGRHMCEVYETEDAAQSAMERRAASL
ncbi:DUF6227 family protein [Streptomyces albidoflavus]|uniref:Uncharacterized protein n=3 Tax=Streptomyces TaxID=1883 RepID=A0AB37XHP5_9ACTN|nr:MULTISPECIES: DUF6227 family protein [Streptomyces]MBO1287613.1 hypothetical protein [Streptomyces sampsonii]MYX52664.1 hypothetical protein [Streptomyces sp. SID8385]MYX84604.1 hypothetical protein [Streptomyces sp. SID4915]NUW07744.1 hypothetical protein [Streptomyces sp. CAI-21]NVI29643.1 hypothetical protein [Streptomyces sp. CAI-17]QLA57116.1 hypothetical protein HWN34_11405 [Streptomyces violascens]